MYKQLERTTSGTPPQLTLGRKMFGGGRYKVAALPLVALLMLILAACGGGADSGPASASPTSANSSASGAESGPVTETRAPTPTRDPASVAALPEGGLVGNRAPDFSGIEAWINSGPLTMEELRGKVVLIDFWTYTCVNCIRTFPFLKLWNSRYSDDGLAIVGVHSPEFEFEKDFDNVVRATEGDGIVWPVAQDNEFETWRSYNNRFWPAKYLIDKDGVVRYSHFGEGAYAETEEKIRELLLETGADFLDENLPLPSDQVVDPAFLNSRSSEVTREIYGGYLRGRSDLLYGQGGYVQQTAFYESPDAVVEFDAPETLVPHKLYLHGPWYVGPESINHAEEAADYDDYLALIYSASSVNAVLTSDSGEPYKVRLTVDGNYLTDENKGADVTIGDNGESYLWVTEPRMYNIIDNPSYVERELLKMSSNSLDFGLFAFTFGVYQKAS